MTTTRADHLRVLAALALAAVLAASLLLLVVVTKPAEAAFPGANGKITFVSERFGVWDADIFMVNPDGTGLQRLTNEPFSLGEPAWSPDGQKIAFSREDGTATEIYIMESNGEQLTLLTNYALAYHRFPAWSPDGQKIAFESAQDGGDSDVYVMDTDHSTNDATTLLTTQRPTIQILPGLPTAGR
jgi:Tol biopolymer transport system component